MKATVKTSVLRFSSFMLCFFLARQLAVAAAGDENWDSNFGVPGADGPVFAIAVFGNNV